MMKKLFTLALLGAFQFGCQNNDIAFPEPYDCQDPLSEQAALHPLAEQLQGALEETKTKGFPGINASISDRNGTWVGAAGYSSLSSRTLLQTCQPMMIASVTKVFTAVLVYQLQEDQIIDLDDLLADHLSGEYMDRIRNAKKVTIRQLLNHTSGLYDYLDPIAFEFISINRPFNSDSPQNKLKLAYGKKPTHEPGETYAYSNTNYVLLGLLVEKLRNANLDQVMTTYIFNPLGLASAYMGTVAQPIAPDAPKGYLSIHANDDLIESEFYYHYDLATADGGIGITMADLNIFMMALHDEELISAESITDMKSALELPEDWKGFYHESNGQGLEIYETPYGTAYGHLGGIVGFTTVSWYFPQQDIALSYSVNGVSPLIDSYQKEFAVELVRISTGN